MTRGEKEEEERSQRGTKGIFVHSRQKYESVAIYSD